eukprot:CFRG3156T1
MTEEPSDYNDSASGTPAARVGTPALDMRQLSPEEVGVLSDCRNGFLLRGVSGAVGSLVLGAVALRAMPVEPRTRSIFAWAILPLVGYLSFVNAGRTYAPICLENMKGLKHSKLSEYAHMLSNGMNREEFLSRLQNPNFGKDDFTDAGDKYDQPNSRFGRGLDLNNAPTDRSNRDTYGIEASVASETFFQDGNDSRLDISKPQPTDRMAQYESQYDLPSAPSPSSRDFLDSTLNADSELDSHNKNPYFAIPDDKAQAYDGNPNPRPEGLTFDEIRNQWREHQDGNSASPTPRDR